MGRNQIISRLEITACAKKIIERNGFREFSLRNLASELNVAPSTIYLYYKDKNELLTALISEFWDNCFSEFQRNPDDFLAELNGNYKHIRHYLRSFKQNWISGFATASYGGSGARGAMAEYTEKIKQYIRTRIREFESNFTGGIYREIGGDYLCLFIYNNLMSMLTGNDDSYDKFELILKNILY